MPWLWRHVSNPSANDILVDVKARRPTDNKAFNLHGIYIAHDATSTKKYSVQTFREGTNETRGYFTITVPANSLPFIIESDEPLIVAIGMFTGSYYEHLRIRAVDGGEPNVWIGIKLKGRWIIESGYMMYA